MAFRNDPIVVGLRPEQTTSNAGAQREGRPDAAEPVDPAEACRQAYAEFRELATKTERRWRWIAAITGVAGIGLGAAVGVWQGRRHALAALPEST